MSATSIEGKILVTSVVDKEATVDIPGTVPMIIGFKEKVGKKKSMLYP